MTQESFKTPVLRPSPGHYLTQAADVDINDRMIASVVALGANDSADNYVEIDEETAEQIRQDQAAARNNPNNSDND